MAFEQVCECGCGQVIHRRDDDPFFKRQVCQALWHASLAQLEDQRPGWRAEQRHRMELWTGVSWNELHVFEECDDQQLTWVANAVMRDVDAGMASFDVSQIEDCLRVLAHRFEVLQSGAWNRPEDRVPVWALVRQANTPTRAAYWTNYEQQSTMDALRATQPSV